MTKKGTKKRSLNLKYKNENIDYNVILAQQPNIHVGRIFEVFFRIVCWVLIPRENILLCLFFLLVCNWFTIVTMHVIQQFWVFNWYELIERWFQNCTVFHSCLVRSLEICWKFSLYYYTNVQTTLSVWAILYWEAY